LFKHFSDSLVKERKFLDTLFYMLRVNICIRGIAYLDLHNPPKIDSFALDQAIQFIETACKDLSIDHEDHRKYSLEVEVKEAWAETS
jgi:hypothetical protein